MMVELTKDDRKVYDIYLLLRKYAPNVNIVTLRQVSLYIAMSTNQFDVNHDFSIILNGSNESYEILLFDGRRIIISGDLNKFGFTVIKEEKNIVMSIKVYEAVLGDLSTANIYGEVKTKNDGMFVVTFRPIDISDDSLKYGTINYYSEDEVNWVYEITGEEYIDYDFDIVAKNNHIYPFTEKCYFDISGKTNCSELDCFDGYIINVLTRIDLLYQNMNVCINNKTKKREI